MPWKPDFHFPPLLRKLKRGGPAITLPKDAGMVIAYSGIGKDSRVIELGSGSGFMTVQLANVAKEVVSYEKRKEFLDIAEANARRAGLSNVVFRLHDAMQGLEEKDCSWDLVFCDIADAEKIVPHALAALKKGGYLAAHCLHCEQAKALHLECAKQFREVFTAECMMREYEVRDFGFRPAHFGLVHTAYLVFACK
jgi:tRNA (adenine57-N1/adenine58-N1)-methyltransferase